MENYIDKNEINNLVKLVGMGDENAFELRNEVSTLSDYDRTPDGEYSVRCRVREGNATVIELNFTVPTEEAAKSVCKNWPKQSQRIYMDILQKLVD